MERSQRLVRGKIQGGKHWVQQKLTEILRGKVGMSSAAATNPHQRRLRKSVRETLAKVITFFHNHRRWMKYDTYLAMGLPVGTGVVESAVARWLSIGWKEKASGGAWKEQRPSDVALAQEEP